MKSASGHELNLTGSVVSFEWRVEELGTHDAGNGLLQCLVHEIYHGNDVPDAQVFGPMICVVAEPFIRIRRARAREMMTEANAVPLLFNS